MASIGRRSSSCVQPWAVDPFDGGSNTHYHTYGHTGKMTAMAKVTISLPDELLARLDDLAELDDLSRSGVVQEAAGEYVARRAATDEAEAWRTAVQSSIDGFRSLSASPRLDSPSGLDLLREVRSLPGTGAPSRAKPGQ